jgi:hypothetical protein
MENDFQIIKRPTSQDGQANIALPTQKTGEISPESNLAYGVRTGLRGGASALSAVAGAPGSAASLALGAGNYFAPDYIPTYEDIQKNWPMLPQTYSQVREGLNTWSGGYLAPQTEGEQQFDDVIADLTGLTRGGNPKTYKDLASRATKAAGKLGLGELASKGAEFLGFDKLGQAISKWGTIFTLGLWDTQRGVVKNMKNNFEKAKTLGENQYFGSTNLNDKLNKITERVHESGGPSKQWALERLEEIRNLTYKGSHLVNAQQKPIRGSVAEVSKIMNNIEQLNQWYKSPNLPVGGRKIIHSISEPLREFIDEYSKSGSDVATQFGKAWNQSRDVYKALKNNWAVTQNLDKLLSKRQLDSPLGRAVTHVLAWNWGAIPKAATLAVSAVAAKEGLKIMDFLSKSSVGRTAYASFLKDMAIGNVSGVERSWKSLDKEARKYGFAPSTEYKITKRPT